MPLSTQAAVEEEVGMYFRMAWECVGLIGIVWVEGKGKDMHDEKSFQRA